MAIRYGPASCAAVMNGVPADDSAVTSRVPLGSGPKRDQRRRRDEDQERREDGPEAGEALAGPGAHRGEQQREHRDAGGELGDERPRRRQRVDRELVAALRVRQVPERRERVHQLVERVRPGQDEPDA